MLGNPKDQNISVLSSYLCSLVSFQRYTKSLTNFQRASLVERSRQKPQDRMGTLSQALKINDYDNEPLSRSCGISISKNFTEVDGRVLPAPKLKCGNGEDFFLRNGRWNFNHKSVEAPFDVFEESPQMRRAPPLVRVQKMFEEIQSKLPGAPKFLLCLLPERKNFSLYGPWKKKSLAEYDIVTQCIAPMKVNDQYLTNVLLKVNAKLGGLNSMLCVEHMPSLPMVSKMPTLILGMDVSHGSPGQSDVPSIAAGVSSRQWPLISKYRASVRTQSPKLEMIDFLFKKISRTEDDGIIRRRTVKGSIMASFNKSRQSANWLSLEVLWWWWCGFGNHLEQNYQESQ